jgi:DNA-directed RNA polymerase-3 subunit RPC5
MWSLSQKEDEDKWVNYEYHDSAEDERVLDSLERLLVHEDRRVRLECISRPLDFLDRE